MVGQFCDLVQVSRNTAYTLIRRGEVQAKKVGAVWRIPMSAYERFCGDVRLEEPEED